MSRQSLGDIKVIEIAVEQVKSSTKAITSRTTGPFAHRELGIIIWFGAQTAHSVTH